MRHAATLGIPRPRLVSTDLVAFGHYAVPQCVNEVVVGFDRPPGRIVIAVLRQLVEQLRAARMDL